MIQTNRKKWMTVVCAALLVVAAIVTALLLLRQAAAAPESALPVESAVVTDVPTPAPTAEPTPEPTPPLPTITPPAATGIESSASDIVLIPEERVTDTDISADEA